MNNINKRYPFTAPKGISGERFLLPILQRHYDVVSDYTDDFAMQCRGVDFGIKKTNYFTDTIKSVFADFEQQMGEALGYDVKINLESLNKKKY